MLLRTSLGLLSLLPVSLVLAAPPELALPQIKPSQVLANPAPVDFLAFADSDTLVASSYEAEWKPDPNDAKRKVQVVVGDHRAWSLGKDEPAWRTPRTVQERPVVFDRKVLILDGESAGGQVKNQGIRIVDAATGKPSHRIEVQSRRGTFFAPLGLSVTVGQGVALDGMILDLTAEKIDPGKTKLKPIVSQQAIPMPVIHAPDGKVMVVCISQQVKPPGLPVNRVDPFYPSVSSWHLADANGRPSARLPLGAGVEWAGGVFSADSKKVAIALDTGRLNIAGSLDPKQVTAQIKEREDRERRNYEQLVKIIICDAQTGKEVARFGKVGLSVLAFSADGRYLAASGPVKGRYTANPDPKKNGGNSLGPEKEPPAKAAMIQLWDVTTRKQVAELVGHEKAVTVLAFSPNGTHLASGGEDKTVRIWDLSKVGDAQGK